MEHGEMRENYILGKWTMVKWWGKAYINWRTKGNLVGTFSSDVNKEVVGCIKSILSRSNQIDSIDSICRHWANIIFREEPDAKMEDEDDNSATFILLKKYDY